MLLPLLLLCSFFACRNDFRNEPDPARVYYQVFLRSFSDSNGDGIGDIAGLTARLDYLADLGVGGIWLMPVHPSGSYHKYDVRDYYGIDPEYGTREEFKKLVKEAHRRNIRVIIDLVLNHTDDEHPWFQAALDGPESPYRAFYVWEDPDSISEAAHLWHSQPADGPKKNDSDEYFYGFFWKGMPDLNYDYPPVRDSILRIGRYWLEEAGVDGFRLDAALLIYPYYEGPRAENFPKTLAWWETFHGEMEKVRPGAFLVGEVWQGDSVLLPFLGKGLDACFHFDLSEWIIGTVRAEKDTFLLAERLRNYPQQDAIFLTNHDQDRLRSRLQGNWAHSRMAAALLLTLPGIPFIYYGEELGMLGAKPDPNIREPFPWGGPGEDLSQTSWQPLAYNPPQQTPPLSLQKTQEGSLWEHYRRLIHFRNDHPVMRDGSIQPYPGRLPEGTLGYYRTLGDEKLLVLHQLSGFKAVLAWNEAGRVLFGTDPGSGLSENVLRLMPYSSLVIAPQSQF